MLTGSEYFTKSFLSNHFFPEPTEGNKIELHFIKNPDKSIRWIYPAKLTEPLFLKFYNATTIKSKIYAFLVEIVFLLRLNRFLKSGSIFTEASHIKNLLGSDLSNTAWALFTGTIGPGRKLISVTKSKKGIYYFTKLAITEKSKLDLENEITALQYIHSINLKDIQVSKIKILDSDSCKFTDLKSKGAFRTPYLTQQHVHAIIDLQSSTINTTYAKSEFWKEISLRISNLKNTQSKIPTDLIGKVEQLQNQLKSNNEFQSYFAHGDFTPWNLYVTKHNIALYDWELAGFQPILFDLFHFICQSGILLQKKNYVSLRKEIDTFINTCTEDTRLNNSGLQPRIYFGLYLLSITTYYINIYNTQEKWHTQVYWLLSFWEKALSEEIAYYSKKKYREIFLPEFFSHLRNSRYAFLKFHYSNIEDIPITSDIDLVVEKSEIETVNKFIAQHVLVKKLNIVKNSMMANFEIFFRDGSMLSVDLIHSIRRKNVVMLEANSVLDSAIVNESGIKVASKINDLLYTWLFYILNDSNIPDKYIVRYAQLYNIELQKLMQEFESILHLRESNLCDIFTNSNLHASKAKIYLKTLRENHGIQKLKNSIQYFRDIIKNLSFNKKGLTITFSGVDGSGKSTVIQETQKLLEKKYRRKVVVIRHRPGILPILSAWKYGKKEAETRATHQLPRKGKNTSKSLSLLRFSYYYLDFILGQFYVWFKYTAQGYIVLYDRYYFDFINDPKRSNINLSSSFIKKFYAAIFKPKLNFFLYAPADVIISRKQELSKEDIIDLTEKYNGLFQNFQKKYNRSAYISIQNIELEKTLQTILSNYQNSLE